jgi:DNA polymerase-4/DNA polymerase V
MRMFEVKKLCPDAVMLPSDYETYSILSQRFFSIVRRYTPDVEEYSIDECFADLTGLRRPLRMNYIEIARAIKRDLDAELGFTFSAGLAPNKVVAKIASKWQKPSGFTAIQARDLHLFLRDLPVEKVWGIGAQTAAYLQKQGIVTALQFARRGEERIKSHLSKPFFEIWQELNGNFVMALDTKEKTTYASVQKVKTFTPPSSDRAFVLAQRSKNIENACMKVRRYKLAPRKVVIFLKTQDFRSVGVELKFNRRTALPNEILTAITPAFDRLFNRTLRYRATGVVLSDLEEDTVVQLELFGPRLKAVNMKRMFESVDALRERYGKHTLFLGSSFLAHQFSQHLGDRGDVPERKGKLLKGETSRRRLAIPMFLGKVS